MITKVYHDYNDKGWDYIYTWDTVPIPQRISTATYKGKRCNYLDIVCAFDIETTTVRCNNDAIAFMYIWQFCIEDKVAMGRTWQDFIALMERLHNYLDISPRTRLVVYVHNLGYEMQFLSGYLDFKDYFAVGAHKPLYALWAGIEFRCSWKLSNMSLSKLLSKTKGVVYEKQSGDDFNYLLPRTPSYTMTNTELLYCYCDVRGLCQAIRSKLRSDNRTLANIPLTSTGYVREKARAAYNADPSNRADFVANRLSPYLYGAFRQARRGGNTHANHLIAGEIVRVRSYDKKSSYPSVMLTKYFPVSPFAPFSKRAIDDDKYCLLILAHYDELRARRGNIMPYIPISHCYGRPVIISADNGRLYHGKDINLALTEIDYRIITETYDIKGETLKEIYGSQRGKLPYDFRMAIMDDFKEKCRLEDGDRYLYDKYKNMINSYFGMIFTDILHEEYRIIDGRWKAIKPDPSTGLDKYYKGRNNFLSYQQALWVTAHARAELQNSINLVGRDTVYVDTDSNKHLGDHDHEFELLNTAIIEEDESNDIPAYVDYNGKRTYLGKWEYEGEFDFLTWGSKKYATQDDNGVFAITVAGLSKDKGAAYIKSMDKFKPGLTVPYQHSGRMAMHYVNPEKPFNIKVGDDIIEIRNYVAAVPVSYTLAITDEYSDMIDYDEDIYYDTGHCETDLTMLAECAIL